MEGRTFSRFARRRGTPRQSQGHPNLPSTLDTNLTDSTQLLPGYMHIGFRVNRLCSERSNPHDDISDRTERYEVYWKPHGADEDAIRNQVKIRGDPPVIIPMPTD